MRKRLASAARDEPQGSGVSSSGWKGSEPATPRRASQSCWLKWPSTRNGREKDSYPDCGENVQRAGKRVTSRRLSAPGLRSQLLKSMKNRTHPQPARADRENTGNEARNERLRKMQAVHERTQSYRDCRSSTTVKTAEADFCTLIPSEALNVLCRSRHDFGKNCGDRANSVLRIRV